MLPGRLGALSLAQPAARQHVNASNSLRFAKASLADPEAQELRPQSSLNSRHLLRRIGFRSLANRVAAEHELAGLVSFDYGQRPRTRLDSPALCGANEQFYRCIDVREIDLGLSGPALNGVMHVRYGRTGNRSLRNVSRCETCSRTR